VLTQLLIWWIAIQLLGLAGLPAAAFLFRALPDRGYPFAKALGLLLTGYLAWLLAMLSLAPFGAPLLAVCALAVLGLGLLLQRGRRGALAAALRAHWPAILAYEAIFAAALVFLAVLRSHDGGFVGPNPWGTERPMDFALFNAIRRSPVFPPHDPWLAGYSINYYYFGYLLMAAVALLTGLEPAVAYNLALALIFALTALGVAGVVANLARLALVGAQFEVQRAEFHAASRRPPAASTQHAELHAFAAALLSIVLVLFAANQGTVLQLVTGTPMVLALEARDLGRAVVNGLGPRAPLYLDPPFKGWDYDGTRVITPTAAAELASGYTDIRYWWPPSRALWDNYPDPGAPDGQPIRRYAITEFPFFSFWLGDMHPHVMALPFCLLAMALALQAAARPAAPPFLMGRRGWAELLLTGVVLGSLYTINSWDFPTYALLFLGGLFLLYARLAREPGDAAFIPPAFNWRMAGGQAAMVLVAAVALFAPFHMTFRSLVGAKEPLVNLPILATLTRAIGVVTWDKSGLHSFMIIFGLFVVPLVAFLLVQRRALSNLAAARRRAGGLLWVALGVLLLGVLAGFPLLALLPLAACAALLALAAPRRPDAFALWGFALGCLICLGVELVYIRDVFESRMNTIFKFYYQVWLLWGTLAGYAFWALLARPTAAAPAAEAERHGAQETPGEVTSASSRGLFVHAPSRRRARWPLAALFLLLLSGGLLYPLLLTGGALATMPAVGLAGITPRQRTPAGAEAIAWLRANAPPGSVVLEAVGDSYDPRGLGVGGVSASTGLPTVLGWPGHEQQWRAGDPRALAQIEPRKADVAAIYSGALDLAQAHALLDRYRVDYIYVGQAERETYPAEGLARLAELARPVFSRDEVTIYQVEREP
jgi:YYY domain-containing protein